MTIIIVTAKSEDAKEILDIYAPYVANSGISFEYEQPSIKEFKQRIENTLNKYPYLVAKIDDKIVGYAYTSEFKNRVAYNWAVEISIYVALKYQNKGIGKALYHQIEKISKLQNILNINACIAIPDQGSVNFHKKMGYYQVAHFHQCGYKLNNWYDIVWMEKIIGEHNIEPVAFIPFSNLDYRFNEQYNILGGQVNGII